MEDYPKAYTNGADKWVINTKTNRWVKVGGVSYRKALAENCIAETPMPPLTVSRVEKSVANINHLTPVEVEDLYGQLKLERLRIKKKNEEALLPQPTPVAVDPTVKRKPGRPKGFKDPGRPPPPPNQKTLLAKKKIQPVVISKPVSVAKPRRKPIVKVVEPTTTETETQDDEETEETEECEF